MINNPFYKKHLKSDGGYFVQFYTLILILLLYTAYLSLIKYHCSPQNKWNVQQLLQTHAVFRMWFFFFFFFFLSITCQWPEDVVGIVLTAVVQGCRWMKQMSGEEGRRWGGGEERRVMGSGCRKSDCKAPNALYAIYFFQEVHPFPPRLPLPPPFLSGSTPLLRLLTFSFNTLYLLLIND